jgi:hypothetical protein
MWTFAKNTIFPLNHRTNGDFPGFSKSSSKKYVWIPNCFPLLGIPHLKTFFSTSVYPESSHFLEKPGKNINIYKII